MSTATTDLVAFLRARLDEDHEVARLVLGGNAIAAYKRGKPLPRWVPSPEGDASVWDTDGILRVKFVWAREMDHIIRHDPARVFAEVDAKRQIVAAYEAAGEPAEDMWGGIAEGLERAVEMLALPYANHPDYQEAWRP